MLQCTLAEIGPAKLTVRSVFWLRISRHGLNCDDIAVEVADPKLCFYSYCSGSQSALNGCVCEKWQRQISEGCFSKRDVW